MLQESRFSTPDGSPHEAFAPMEDHVRIMQDNAKEAQNLPVARIVATMALLYAHQTQLTQALSTDRETLMEEFFPDTGRLITLIDNNEKTANLDADGNNKGSAHVVSTVLVVAKTLQALREPDTMWWSTDTHRHYGATHPGVITDSAELEADWQSFTADKKSGAMTRMRDIYDMFKVEPEDFRDTTKKGLRSIIQRLEVPTNVGVSLVVYNQNDARGNTLFSWVGVKPPSRTSGTK